MIKCAILNREFETKSEMYAALMANKSEILALKTATIKMSEGIRTDLIKEELVKKHLQDGIEIKGEPVEYKGESGYIYPVINTTNYMDSHKDVHFDGIWDKSISEQQGKIYYPINHKLEIGKIVAYPKDVRIFTKTFSFKDLGYDADGDTQALVYEVKLQDYANKDALAVFENKLPAQNSVRMQYVKVRMGIDSSEKGYEEEKAYYDKMIDKISNKEEVAKDGYFFGITEAKIVKEGSLVLLGSNSVTPVLYPSEPEKSTHEPDTNKESAEEKASKEALDSLLEFYNNVKF